MDGGGRIDRDSDLGDDSPMVSSHTDEQSDREDDIRDCDSSEEGVNINNIGLNGMMSGGLDFNRNSPDHHSDLHMGQSSHLANHPLNLLGNLSALNMGTTSLQSIQNFQNLQRAEVIEKLKMQVRDMRSIIEQENIHNFGIGGNNSGGSIMHTPANTAFTLPNQPQNLSQSTLGSISNGFSFTTPNLPSTKDGNPGSNSSTSSETSNSSQQNNGWSFEEQYKQVRQLYEINDDPKRKEFLDDLFSYMQKRGTPINRLPIMAKSVLDLYELYNLVIARGGLVDVINKKLWQEIIKGLHLPSSITSAAFTLRTQYMKYLYPYECEKKNLSTPGELQAAIDGNRREGRRSSYGQFDSQMQGQLQMPQVQRSPIPGGMQQMSPLSLVTHGNTPGSAAAAAAAHHRLMGAPSVGQIPNLMPQEIEQRMMEYIKLFQTPKEHNKRNGSQSPEISPRDALNALEMSRVALWSMYNNNTSPPTSINTSPPGNEPQRFANELQMLKNQLLTSNIVHNEALNLSESLPIPQSMNQQTTAHTTTHHGGITIKRERDQMDYSSIDRDHDIIQPPPAKRGNNIINNNNNNNNNMDSMMAGLNDSHMDDEDDIDHDNHLNLSQQNHMLHNNHRQSNTNNNNNNKGMHKNNNNNNVNDEDDEDEDEDDNGNNMNSRLLHQHNNNNHLSNHNSSNKNSINKKYNGQTENNQKNQQQQQQQQAAINGGMQFKIASRGSALTGDQQLVVAMEFNGTLYEGVLFANKVTSSTAIAEAATTVATTTGGNSSTTPAIQSIPTTPTSPKVASAAHNGITSPTSANLTVTTSPAGRTTPVPSAITTTTTTVTGVDDATNVITAAAAAATIGIKRNSLDDRTTRVPHPLVSS